MPFVLPRRNLALATIHRRFNRVSLICQTEMRIELLLFLIPLPMSIKPVSYFPAPYDFALLPHIQVFFFFQISISTPRELETDLICRMSGFPLRQLPAFLLIIFPAAGFNRENQPVNTQPHVYSAQRFSDLTLYSYES